MKHVLKIALLSALLHGCAGANKAQLQQQLDDYVDLPSSHFQSTVSVRDDALDTVAIFSTEPGFRFKQGLLGIVWEDNFIRGFIDKRTKARTFQVYTYVMYRDSGWRFYETANYEAPGGPKSVPVTKIHSDVDCTASSSLGCRYEEHVGFSIDEALVQEIAGLAGRTRGQLLGWRYKIRPHRGEDYQAVLSASEVKGLLDAMDSYKP